MDNVMEAAPALVSGKDFVKNLFTLVATVFGLRNKRNADHLLHDEHLHREGLGATFLPPAVLLQLVGSDLLLPSEGAPS